jgi:hypothetical protein
MLPDHEPQTEPIRPGAGLDTDTNPAAYGLCVRAAMPMTSPTTRTIWNPLRASVVTTNTPPRRPGRLCS